MLHTVSRTPSMEDTGSIYKCGFVVLVYGTLITKGSASKTQEETNDGLIEGRETAWGPGGVLG